MSKDVDLDERRLWLEAADRYTRRYLDAMLAELGDVEVDEKERQALYQIARHEGPEVVYPLVRVLARLRASRAA
ncbi:hypothetical protein AB0J38_14530 [Streptomyces sp. NPDC050095]|uniref:hypothetical protein n=1 Tax=unclassified Streptomyces TaxID=2593676 RepID=UPI00341B8C62